MAKKKNSYYFSHDSNARNDDKIIAIRMRHGAEGYAVYFMILERMRDDNEYMSIKDYNMLAFDFRVPASLVKSVVEDFGLFTFTEDGKRFYSESFLSRMKIKDSVLLSKSEAGKKGMNNRWGNNEDMSRSQRLKEARLKGTHTNKEWDDMKSFFGECVCCGSKDELYKNHIIPISKGGDDSICNIQPLCKRCNSMKSDNSDFRIKWSVKHNARLPDWMTHNKCITNKSKMHNNKSKVNKKNTLTEVRVEEIPQTTYETFIPIDDLKSVLISQEMWIEDVMRNFNLSKISVYSELDRIICYWKLQGIVNKTLQDAKSHFVNILRIEKKKSSSNWNNEMQNMIINNLTKENKEEDISNIL